MAERRSIWRWISFINMACIASAIDAKHYLQSGTVQTWSGGWQPAHQHPWAAALNLLFDLGSLVGMILTVRDALAARWAERRAGPDDGTSGQAL